MMGCVMLADLHESNRSTLGSFTRRKEEEGGREGKELRTLMMSVVCDDDGPPRGSTIPHISPLIHPRRRCGKDRGRSAI